MAPLNPAPQETQSQPYFWSKPTSEPKPDVSGEIKGKVIGGALDEGASALKEGVQGITAAYEKGIQNTIYNAVDPLRDQYMERLHSADESMQGRDTPDPMGRDAPRDVKGLPNTLNTLDSARANGKLSQTDYDARLSALAKEVRGKYPGYRAYVDEEFKRITGRDSANQYIKSVISDIDSFTAARKGVGDKIADKILGEGMSYSGASMWYQKMKADPEKYGPAALQWLNDNRQADHELEMASKKVEFLKNTDSYDKEKMSTLQNEGVTKSGAHFYTASLDTIGTHLNLDPKTNDRYQDIINKIRRGENVTDVKPQEAVQLRTFMEQQKAGLSAERAADLSHAFPNMKTEEISKVVKDELASYYDPYMEALGKGDFSLAEQQKNLIKAKGIEAATPYFDSGKWANTHRVLTGLAEVKDPLGPQIAIAAGSQASQEQSAELTNAAAAAVAPPSSPNHKPLGQTAQELRIKNNTDGKLWKSLVELHATAATKGPNAISDDSAKALITSAFGPKSKDLLGFFSGASGNKGLGQQWVFDTLASNGMVDRTAKLSKETPELYQHLKDWAGNNMKYLLNKDITTPADPRYGSVQASYDTNSHSFSFKEPTTTAQGRTVSSNDPYRTKELQTLKGNMDRLVHIVEKDPNQHTDPSAAVYQLLKGMNAPEGSLVAGMIKSMEVAHP